MAIFSCKHGSIGRATHRPGTAGAHAHYIARPGAVREIVGEHMPTGRKAAEAWLNDQELADRKNARVIDKVLLALPVELDAEQRVQLVRDFAAEVGKGRIPWMAGIHDTAEDAHNPHAHVIFRDRDFETGKRVAELSERGSTERIRELWETAANRALEEAGLDARIDRRSLEEQGIAREPGIHVGPNVLAMEEKGLRPESMAQELENGRVINWPDIDQGRTRADRLREILAGNELGLAKEGGRKTEGRASAAAPAIEDTPAPARDDLEPTPATPEVEDPSLRMARALQAFAEQDRGAKAAQEAQERPSSDQGKKPRREPEASQRASAEQEEALAKERSRLARAIERGREKLQQLANRLDAAFQRVLYRKHEPFGRGADRLRQDRELFLEEIEAGQRQESQQAHVQRVDAPPVASPKMSDREKLIADIRRLTQPQPNQQGRTMSGHGPRL